MTISGDYLFIGLIVAGLFLLQYSGRRKNILVAMVTSVFWFALGMWLFFGTAPPLDLSDSWAQVLAYGFFVLMILPWLFQMDTEIMNEARGKSWFQRWTSYGEPGSRNKLSGHEEYKKRLYRRTRR